MSVAAFVFLCCLATTSVSETQQPPSTESEAGATTTEPKTPAVTENIVVTATRSERRMNELPPSVAVISREAIESSPVRSVDDLIREVPGVTPSLVSSSGSTPNNQRFSMHGLGGTRALVLLDGIPLHDPYSGVVQWQYVPLQSLRQIEVVRGGNASLFGNYALGGTVNLLTRPIEDNVLSLDLSYGSRDTERGSITFDSVINDDLSLRLSHYRTSTDGYFRVPDPGQIDIPAWVDNAVTTARLQFQPSERGNGFLSASSTQYDWSQGTPISFSNNDVESFSGGYNQAVGAAGLLSARAYLLDQKEHVVNSRTLPSRDREFKTQDGIVDSRGSGGSMEVVTQHKGRVPTISFGLDVRQLEVEDGRTSFNQSGAVTLVETVGGRQRFAGLFVQASWFPSDRLEVLGSGRLDWYGNENGFNAVEGGETTLYEESSTTQFDPRISIRYALGGRSTLRGSIYRAFNAPTLRELYRNSVAGTSTILGNPALEPETLVGAEAGWEWADGSRRLELNLFYNEVDGLQSRVSVDGTPFLFQYRNLGTSRSQGVEVTGDLRLSRHWQMRGSYAFTDAVVTSDPNPDFVGNMITEVPRHAGSLAIRYQSDRGVRGEVRARAESLQYGDIGNDAVSPAHQVVDMSLSVPVGKGFEVYALVENIFDELYYQALTPTAFRTGLPRTVSGGIRLNGFRWRSSE